MSEEPQSDKVAMTPLEPIKVTVVGTPRDENAPRTQLVETPEGQRDVLIKYVSPMIAILVDFGVTFLTVLVAAVSAASTTTTILPYSDLRDLAYKTGALAMSGALAGLGKNLLALLIRLKKQFPLDN